MLLSGHSQAYFCHIFKTYSFMQVKAFLKKFGSTAFFHLTRSFSSKLQCFQKSFMTNVSNNPVQKLLEGKEVEFPVSWGVIRGKQFGNPNGIPVLALHGWLDNCHSFLPLMSYILEENNLNVICLDEPGCGLSSHKPKGSDYKRWSYLSHIKRIIDILNWKDITLIGHSQGGHYALLFSSIFPTLVKRTISIDIVKPLSLSHEGWRDAMAYIIDKHVEIEELFLKNQDLHLTAPRYSKEVALAKLMDSHGHSLNEASAKVLLQRGTKWVNDGYIFTRDIRLKLPPIDPMPNLESIFLLTEGIRSDLLIILGEQSIHAPQENVKKMFYNMYEKNCRMFRSVSLPGTHHLHMNDPDVVGQVINVFIKDSLKLDEP